MSKLPKGWAIAKLGEILELKYGKALPDKVRDKTGFPVFGSNGVVGHHSVPHTLRPSIVVGRKGSIGEAHLSAGPCSPIDTTYYIDDFHGQPPLFWLFRIKALNLASLNRATALPGLNRNDAYELPVPLPPLNEQRRIVAKIEALQERSRRVRASLEAIGPLMERFRQSVLAAAFRGDLTREWRKQNPKVEPASVLLERIRKERRQRWEEAELAKMTARGKTPKDDRWKEKYKEPAPVQTEGLPKLPEGWAWASLEELASVGTGSTPSRSNPQFWDNGSIPWIKSGALNKWSVDSADELITQAAVDDPKGRLRIYDPGTLLLAMYGEGKTRGKCSELRIKAATNQAIAAIVFYEESELLRPYVRLFFEKNYYEIRMLSSGGVQPNLNCGIVSRLLIPLAPQDEQSVIATLVGRSLKFERSMLVRVAQAIEIELKLNQSILAKAFRGELVPQDPTDEPASVLLERIRAERAAESGGMPRKARSVKPRPPKS